MPTAADTHSSLDEQICFALYNASRALTGRYRNLLAPLGVTYPQYLVLLLLWQSGALTVSELGERLALDSGTLSPMLRRLEASGLVVRSRLNSDERVVTVSTTLEGDRLKEKAAGIPGLICAATGLEITELQALREQVAALTESVRVATAAAAATP